MPKPRKENNRKFRERVLILCEGTETEPRYFKGLKADKSRSTNLSAVDIEIYQTKINTGKELVSLAKTLMKEAKNEENEYDSVWVVIDKDGYKKHPQTFNQAEALNINIAFSSISFEYWFLLHFTSTTKAFAKADELISFLKKSGYKNYDKTLDHYLNLKEHTEKAVKHAEACRNQKDYQEGDRIYTLNPYTDVDKLVSYLLSL